MRNPAETVAKVLAAEEAVQSWDAAQWLAIAMEAPDCLQNADTMTWAVTVEAFRSEGEPVMAAAQRLALYLDLHAEVSGRPPRLEAVQANAIQSSLNRTMDNLARTLETQ